MLPILQDQDPSIRLSVSRVNLFNQCKAKYKYTYILKLPKKSFTFHIFGRFLHKTLELFHLSFINGSDESLATVMSKSYKEALLEYKDKLSPEDKKEAYEILNKYLKRVTLNKSELKSIIAAERDFNVEIAPQISLNGMIDRIQVDSDDIIHIIDYKTSKSKTYLKDDALQLLTYAYVLFLENPSVSKIRTSYMMLRHDFDLITKEFGKDEILEIKSKYEEFGKRILEENQWNPEPTRLCQYCEFLEHCPTGQKFIQPEFKFGETKW